MFVRKQLLKLKTWMQFFCILFFLSSSVARAEVVHVAVASNFILPAQEIARAFESETSNQIKLSNGSSGKFYAQIKQGAPFQVFLSADSQTPERLSREGVALPSTQITYAIGKLVLWSANGEMITNDASILDKNIFKKIAIANPELAPYGKAAIETLNQLGQYNQIQSKIVWGENIAQTHQFVLTGNAQLGFVSASQVMREGKFIEGSGWVVPESLYQPILQDAILLTRGKNSSAAIAFLKYLESTQSQSIIQKFGYGISKKM